MRKIIAKYSHPDYGYISDSKEVQKILCVDNEYIVKTAIVGQSSTSVKLEGFNQFFNSVYFDYYDEGGTPVDIIKEYLYTFIK